MRRHTLFFFVLALALASAPHCRAQNTPQSILPDRFADWISTAPPDKVKPAEQDAALLTEAGLEEWLIRRYSNGSQILKVSLERFHDPSGAYEAYTALLDTDLEPSTVGQLTAVGHRSEEHTSELQSRGHLVCRLLLEKKKNKQTNT